MVPKARPSVPRWPKVLHLWRHSQKTATPKKNFFPVQTRRLAASFETYRVCIAYWTGEIPVQCHVRLGVFFQKSPKPAGHRRVKETSPFVRWLSGAWPKSVGKYCFRSSNCLLYLANETINLCIQCILEIPSRWLHTHWSRLRFFGKYVCFLSIASEALIWLLSNDCKSCKRFF